MKLDIFTKKALEKEFPFLETLFVDGVLRRVGCPEVKKVPGMSPENVTIKKVDETFLNSIPKHHGWTGSLVNHCAGTEIIFILANGDVVRDAVKQETETGSNYAYEDTYRHDGETVLAAIERLGVVDLTHIVEREYGIHTTDHHSHGENMVIRKVTIPIDKFINKAYKQAEEKIQARLCEDL